jgi:hypothetical protein
MRRRDKANERGQRRVCWLPHLGYPTRRRSSGVVEAEGRDPASGSVVAWVFRQALNIGKKRLLWLLAVLR